jgi:hypothetical protein
MKKIIFLTISLFLCLNVQAWWSPGHMVTAMIAYKNLNKNAKAQVDRLTKILQRDYPYTNHITAMSTWADDLKAEGERSYNSWHYTNIPYNPKGIALPPKQNVDVLWAIDQAKSVLKSKTTNDVDKARQLAFLIHFVGDIHQPLHSTTYYTNSLPAGNVGGNAFPISSFGKWRNLHQAWDDGCGYLSEYNDIDPYGEPKEPVSEAEIERLEKLAKQICKKHPEKSLVAVEITDQDFWALEGHKLAIKYGYKGVQSVDEKGWKKYVKPNDPLSEYYLEQGQAVVEERLAMGGYRLARVLNELFPE